MNENTKPHIISLSFQFSTRKGVTKLLPVAPIESNVLIHCTGGKMTTESCEIIKEIIKSMEINHRIFL